MKRSDAEEGGKNEDDLAEMTTGTTSKEPYNSKRTCRSRAAQLILLIVYLALLSLTVVVSLEAFRHCGPGHFLNGADSWGRECGSPPAVPLHRAHLWRVGFEVATRDIGKGRCGWRELMRDAPADVCVARCPRNVTSVKACGILLSGIGAEERVRDVVMSKCRLMDEVFERCKLNRSQLGEAPRSVLGRCVPAQSANDKYQPLEGYVSLWQYVVDDFLHSVTAHVIGQVVAVVMSFTVCILFISAPCHSLLGCAVLNVVVAAGSVACHCLNLYRMVDGGEYSKTDLALRAVLASLALIATLRVMLGYCNDRYLAEGTSALLRETSGCLRSTSKLLALALLFLILKLAFVAFALALALHAANCHQVSQPSDRNGTVDTNPLPGAFLPHDWAVGAALALWSVLLLGAVQDMTVARAVRSWYSTDPDHEELIAPALGAVVRGNMGDALTCSFSSWILHDLARRVAERRSGKSAGEGEGGILWHLSPHASAAVGVYGRARPTLIGHPNPGEWRIGMPEGADPAPTSDEQEGRYWDWLRERGAGWSVRECHHVIISAVWWTRLCVVTATLASFTLAHRHRSHHALGIQQAAGAAIAWLVSGALLGVVGVAVDAVACCFVDDVTRHRGTGDDPFRSSPRLVASLAGVRPPRAGTRSGVREMSRRERARDEEELRMRERRERDRNARRRASKTSTHNSRAVPSWRQHQLHSRYQRSSIFDGDETDDACLRHRRRLTATSTTQTDLGGGGARSEVSVSQEEWEDLIGELEELRNFKDNVIKREFSVPRHQHHHHHQPPPPPSAFPVLPPLRSNPPLRHSRSPLVVPSPSRLRPETRKLRIKALQRRNKISSSSGVVHPEEAASVHSSFVVDRRAATARDRLRCRTDYGGELKR